MDLKNNIINKFENLNFYEKYGNDITITIVLITITILITIYFLFLATIRSQRYNWNEKKCNPLLMPFASVITNNKDSEGNYSRSFIEKNFNECLNELNYEIGTTVKTPLDNMIDIIMSMFNYAALIVDQIFSFFLYLLNLLFEIFKLFISYVEDLLKRTNVILQNFISIINYMLDILDIIKYTLMNLLDFVKYSFFVIAGSFSSYFVIPTIVTFTTLTIIAIIARILAIALGWLFPLLLGNAVITTVFAILSLIIMIFFIVLSTSINKTIKEILCSSSLFKGACPPISAD